MRALLHAELALHCFRKPCIASVSIGSLVNTSLYIPLKAAQHLTLIPVLCGARLTAQCYSHTKSLGTDASLSIAETCML